MQNTNKRGGYRPNAGAPKKAPTKPIFIRVALSDYNELLKRCKAVISSFYNNA